MLIAKGPDEDIRSVNAGLLFFSKTPEVFFPRKQIELVWHRDDSGKSFKEYIFKGPLYQQLRATLSFIKTNIISEKEIKHTDRAKAERFDSFPILQLRRHYLMQSIIRVMKLEVLLKYRYGRT